MYIWGIEFKAPIHGKIIDMINWTTGRYRLEVFDFGPEQVLASTEGVWEV